MSAYLDSLLLSSGLAPKEKDSQPQGGEAFSSGPGTAIELRSGRAQLLRIISDLVTIAMVTDRRDLSDDRKRKDAMARFVMDRKDPTKALVLPVWFIQDPPTAKGTGRMYRAKFDIPDPTSSSGYSKVIGVPHVVANGIGGRIVYGDPTGEYDDGGEMIVKPKEHWVAIMRPLHEGGLFKLLPTGLASEMNLATWRKLVEQLEEQNLPHFESIKHNLLGRERTMYIIIKPKGLWRYRMPNDKKEPTGPYHHGTIDGLSTVCIGPDSDLAPFDDDDACAYTEDHVFLVQPEESRLRLLHVNRLCDAKLAKGSLDGLGAIQINAFEALGKSPRELDMSTLADQAYHLAASRPGMENALWAWAVQNGYLDPLEVQLTTVKPVLMGLAPIVIEQGRNELATIRKEVATRLSWATLPELEEILAGDTIQTAYWRTTGPDAMSAWMEEHIEGGEFDWKSWLHCMVRRDLLAIILGKRGEAVPEKPAGTGKPKGAPKQAPGRPAPVEPKADPVVVVAAPAEASTSDAPPASTDVPEASPNAEPSEPASKEPDAAEQLPVEPPVEKDPKPVAAHVDDEVAALAASQEGAQPLAAPVEAPAPSRRRGARAAPKPTDATATPAEAPAAD